MPKGKCKECGRIHWSWAFAEENCSKESLTCRCGGEIEIKGLGDLTDD